MRFLLILLLSSIGVAFSQAPSVTPMQITKLGTVYPANHTVNWNVQLTKHKYPSPGGSDYRSELERRKGIVEQRFPRKNANRGGGTWPTDSLPRIGKAFEGNLAGNSTPNDNNLAISNSGFLVSVVNSNIYFYDTNADTLMYNNSLGAWTLPLNITSGKFDPKAIYDPRTNKFIVVFLHGSSPLQSNYIVCFSTSDNPMDPWNMYKLPGNPFDDNSWSDYPALAISRDDLFLTINLIQPGVSWQLGFKQSLIWQIEKATGYNGDSTLNSQIWSGIEYAGQNLRNLHPVRNARGQHESQNDLYFLSNKNFAIESDSIFLVHLNGSLQSGNAAITIDLLASSPSYFLAVNAPEPSGQELATNDSRILGGMIEGNSIQFVQNSTDTATGNSAIYHGTIDLTNMSCAAQLIKDSVLNFGYCNIAGVSNSPGGQESIIAFEYSSDVDFPGFAAVYYDGNGNYSPVKQLKAGENNISVFSDPVERWGDYLPVQRKYNEPCKVWTSGTFGKANQDNGTWIAELETDGICDPLPLGVEESAHQKVLVFPNPAQELVSCTFQITQSQNIDIRLYDLEGKLVQVLLQDHVSSGNYQFSFNTSHLSNGVYILLGEGNGFTMSQRVVINH